MLWTVNVDGGPSGAFYKTLAVGEKIYAIGGNESRLIKVYVLQTENYKWSVLKNPNSSSPQYNQVPRKRTGHTAVVYKEMAYIWGGSEKVANCNALYCFDTTKHQWSKPTVKGRIPAPKSGHSACVINGAMFVFGGFETESQTHSQDVYKLDLSSLKWSYVQTTGEPPIRREKHSATVIDNKMFIFGGLGNGGPNGPNAIVCNDVMYLDTNTMQWITPELKGLFRPIGRFLHLSFCYDDALFVFGGWNGYPVDTDLFSDLLRYDPGSCSWSIVRPRGNGPLQRFGQQCCLVGNRVFVIGGMRTIEVEEEDEDDYLFNDYDQELFDDLFVLDLAPSLKTLSIMAVVQHKLDQGFLPETVQSDIREMTIPSPECGAAFSG